MASTRIHIDEARLGRVQKQDRFATGVLTAIVAIVMLIVISMVAYILFEGISTLFQPGFLTQPARANGTQGGVLYQLFDSFYLLLITLAISVPISLGGAVFLVEYAPNGPIRDIASTAIETLSSLPSIVVGMFGFLVFSVQLGWKYSIISGAVALTMFNIPILVRVSGKAVSDEVVLSTKDVNVYYGDHHALHNTSLDFHKGEITALIGPSGCGKSTFLRSLNLMNREIRGCRVEGEINYRGRNVNTRTENTYELRCSIGMVFQQPNPFRKSIRDNITFAPKRHGITDRDELDRMVEESLRGAALWDEVKDKLDKSAYALSGGQQQRLCIARTLALNPDVILFDEPCSALDPISTLAIEDLMSSIVAERAIVIVTHNMEQASRVSNRTAFFYMGDMVEYDETDEFFQRPKDKRLNDYLTGMFS